jgi:hypothetical protein
MKRFLFCWLALLPLLGACVGLVDQGPGVDESTYHFTEAMRWRDYAAAARFVEPQAQPEFSACFPRDDEDLRIVESRLETLNVKEDQQSAEADYVLEYYRLPSSRVKKWRWTQHWRLRREKPDKPGVWLIVNAPPPLP